MDILKVSLYLLIIALPLGVVLRVNLISFAYIYPVDIVVFSIFLWFLIDLVKKRKIPSHFSFFKPLILFLGFSFLSLVLNSFRLTLLEFFVSFLYLARFVAYSSLLFSFHYLDSNFNRRYLTLLSISGFLVVFFGFIQYFFYPNLRNLYYLGWDEHLYRMFSTFLDPNFAGAFFVLELLLLLSLLIQSFVEQSLLLKRISLSIGVALALVAVILTYSRSAFLMLLVSIVLLFFFIRKLKWIVGFIIFIALIILIIPKDLNLEPINLLRTASIEARMESIKKGMGIFKTSPIYGIGFNSYRYGQLRHGFLDELDIESHAGAGVSNSFVFVIATTGIIGFVLYLNFWYQVLKKLFGYIRNKKGGNFYYVCGVVASIIGIFTHSLFENTLFYPFIMLWIFSLIGIYLRLARD